MTSCSPSEGGTLVRRAGAACKLALAHHLQWEFLGKCVAKCSAVVACSGVFSATSMSVGSSVTESSVGTGTSSLVETSVVVFVFEVLSVLGVLSVFGLSELLAKLASVTSSKGSVEVVGGFEEDEVDGTPGTGSSTSECVG